MVRRHSFLRGALAAAVLVGAPFASHAQVTSTSAWDAWIGCWDLIPRATSAESPSRVCVIPTASSHAVEVLSVVGDSVLSRQRLDATGQPRGVTRDNCKGTETISATGMRVYLRTSLTCGTVGRLTNSVMAMSYGGEWIDVQGVAIGSNVGVRAARYRETPATTQIPTEVATVLRGRPRGMHAARIAASGTLRPSDVVEASRHLEVGVMQTWLAERGQGFLLDARQLVALEESGVSPSVIDIMVALSYPEVFALDRTRLGEAPPDLRGDDRVVFGGDMIDDYYGGGYGYDPYGIGYGRGYGWYPGRQPVVVVRAPSGEVNDEEHGKVVKGRGYVSGRGSSDRSAESGGSSSSGRAGSSGSSGGSSDKGSSTGRKAKPKGG
ncbi:MAG: hypothetical protein IPK85_09965 [Gemmatimonadetes bacterium]|nr:hypothetical protein [Gemmatimonadota bacterium]